MHLLVVEDERALCETIVRSLRRLAYSVDSCYDGEKALELLSVEQYDLVLLDLNLPGKDGMTVLRTLRQTDRETRVLILSARSEVADKVAGLDAGANDYLAKPFSTGELLARIRALSRRGGSYTGEVLSYEDLTFDKGSLELSGKTGSIRLGPKEAHLIELLLKNPGQVMPKDLLIEKIWGLESEAEYNNIEVYISFLRQKFASLNTPVQIKTVRGIGYRLEVSK